MANIVSVHGFAHRLRNDGLMESCPVDPETEYFSGEWKVRTKEDMDLSGGDWSLVYETLKRFKQIFQSDARRTPAPAVPVEQKSPESSGVA